MLTIHTTPAPEQLGHLSKSRPERCPQFTQTASMSGGSADPVVSLVVICIRALSKKSFGVILVFVSLIVVFKRCFTLVGVS